MNTTIREKSAMVVWTLSTVAALLFCGCASEPIVLGPVGPAPASASAPIREGFLRIYTAIEKQVDGDAVHDVRSGYGIYTPDGKRFKWVENHVGQNDELPQTVRLPEGTYTVKAQAEGFRRITVPVVIKTGKLTEVNLETSGRKRTSVTNETAVVRLPNGDVVGWRAELPKQSETK